MEQFTADPRAEIAEDVDVVAFIEERPLEAASVLFSILYLVLAIRENLWCWPAAFLSSALTLAVVLGARLYSEVALNAYYAAMAVYGWYQWHYGGHLRGAAQLPIGVWPLKMHALAFGGRLGLR